MPPPLLLLAFPPLLVLYPLSYATFLFRSIVAPLRVKSPQLLHDGKLVDPTTGDAPLAQRVGADGQVPYAEDAVLWESRRVAIISCDPGRPEYNPFTNEGDASKAKSGKLMVYDLDMRAAHELSVANWPAGRLLHPLGVGIKEDGDGALLAVANMGPDFAAVEMLRLVHSEQGISAVYLCSLENPLLTVPNAVVPLSESAAVVTNSFRFEPRGHPVLNKAETILAPPLSYVLHMVHAEALDTHQPHKTATAEVVAKHFSVANGIAMSKDGRALLVAGCMSSDVSVYDVAPSGSREGGGLGLFGPRLHYRETLPVGFVIDNLRYVAHDPITEAKEGYTFLGAGHAAGLDFLATAHSKGVKRAGSRVVRITVPAPPPVGSYWRQPPRSLWTSFVNELSRLFVRVHPRVQLVFADDGQLLSTSSTAAAFPGKNGGTEMLVTGLWDERGPIHVAGVDL